MNDDEGMTYAEAGVDIDASEAATQALIAAGDRLDDSTYAGIVELNGLRIGLTTDGVGTKLLVADALETYDTIGIDCIAMNVNDLIAGGLRPIGFVDYLALESPDEDLTAALGEGLAVGAQRADVALLGGETAILPEVIDGFDLAGAAIGIADHDNHFEASVTPGDALVGIPSSGIHSNGLTLARQAVTARYEYQDPFPPDASRSIGEELLTPTRIYTEVVSVLSADDVHGCAHVTGGGLRNLARMGDYRYVITDPPTAPPVFAFVQECGSITDREMYQTFNMGLGFVIATDPDQATTIANEVDGHVVGHIEEGTGIDIAGVTLDSS